MCTTRPTPTGNRNRCGFTLVELLLVVVLLSLLAGVATPRFSRSVRTRAAALAAEELGVVIETGRREAVRRGLRVRVVLDPRQGEYRLELQEPEHPEGLAYGAFGEDFLDGRRTLPQGVTVEGLERGRDGASELVFEPSGAGEEMELRLVDASGVRAEIRMGAWYEDVTVLAGEPARP